MATPNTSLVRKAKKEPASLYQGVNKEKIASKQYDATCNRFGYGLLSYGSREICQKCFVMADKGAECKLVHYPRELIAERVVLTPADHAQIAACRGPHNRLGFAYQLGFLHLTGRFPAQQPLEMLSDLLAFVAQEVAVDPHAIADYAQRQATVSAHQDLIRLPLGFRVFDPTERDALSHFLG